MDIEMNETKDTKTKFHIRVVYKSGYTHDFWCYSFGVSGGEWSWEAAEGTNRPLVLGVDNIESVWQIGIEDE